MQLTGGKVREVQVSLLLSSRAEMQKVIEKARQASAPSFVKLAAAAAPIVPKSQAILTPAPKINVAHYQPTKLQETMSLSAPVVPQPPVISLTNYLAQTMQQPIDHKQQLQQSTTQNNIAGLISAYHTMPPEIPGLTSLTAAPTQAVTPLGMPQTAAAYASYYAKFMDSTAAPANPLEFLNHGTFLPIPQPIIPSQNKFIEMPQANKFLPEKERPINRDPRSRRSPSRERSRRSNSRERHMNNRNPNDRGDDRDRYDRKSRKSRSNSRERNNYYNDNDPKVNVSPAEKKRRTRFSNIEGQVTQAAISTNIPIMAPTLTLQSASLMPAAKTLTNGIWDIPPPQIFAKQSFEVKNNEINNSPVYNTYGAYKNSQKELSLNQYQTVEEKRKLNVAAFTTGYSGQTGFGNIGQCVKVSNVDSEIYYSDIRKFFAGLSIGPNDIKYINDDYGNKTGIVLIRFLSSDSKKQALTKNGWQLKNNQVMITSLSESDYDKAQDNAKAIRQPGSNSVGNNQGNNYNDNNRGHSRSTSRSRDGSRDRDRRDDRFQNNRSNNNDRFSNNNSNNNRNDSNRSNRNDGDRNNGRNNNNRFDNDNRNNRGGNGFNNNDRGNDGGSSSSRQDNRRDQRDNRDNRDNNRDQRDNRDQKDNRDQRDNRDNRDQRDNRVQRESRDSRDQRSNNSRDKDNFDDRSFVNQEEKKSEFVPDVEYKVLIIDDLPRSAVEKDIIEAFPKIVTLSIDRYQAHAKFETHEAAKEALEDRCSQFIRNKRVFLEPGSEAQFAHITHKFGKYDNFDMKPKKEKSPTTTNIDNDDDLQIVEDTDDRMDNDDATKDDNSEQKQQINRDPRKPQSDSRDPRQRNNTERFNNKRENSSSNNSSNSQNLMPMPKSDCIIIKNLELNATIEDVEDFFKDIGISQMRVHILLNRRGQPCGDCFVEFKTSNDAVQAIEKNGKFFGENRVQIMLIPREQVEAVLNSFGGSGGGANGSDQQSRGSGSNGGNSRDAWDNDGWPPNDFGKPGCVVLLSNVCYRTSTEDIIYELRDFNLEPSQILRRFNDLGQPTVSLLI